MANVKFNWEKIKTLTPIIVPFLSFFLGSGIVWNWMNLNIENERNEFQRQQISIQKDKNSFEKMKQMSIINEKLTERFVHFLNLHEEYISLLREYDKYDQTNQIKAGDLERKMQSNRSQSYIILEEITKLEKDIAKIENRKPRDLGSNAPLLPPIFKEIKPYNNVMPTDTKNSAAD